MKARMLTPAVIGAQVGLSFNDFLLNLAPVILIIIVVHTLAIHLIWGRALTATPEDRARIMALDERKAITAPKPASKTPSTKGK